MKSGIFMLTGRDIINVVNELKGFCFINEAQLFFVIKTVHQS
jgi:hypothetical protein